VPGEPAIRSNLLRFRIREVSDYFPEAYERLILDALSGDSTLFIRADESELAWKLVDTLEAAWNSVDADAPAHQGGLFRYCAGTPLNELIVRMEDEHTALHMQ